MWKSYHRVFIARFARTFHWSLIWAVWLSILSHHIVLRFSWIFSYYLCLGLPSRVLIWGHCVLEIQCVNVCLYWNYYSVVSSRTVFWGVYAVLWECYTLCLWWWNNWDLFVPLDKTRSCRGLSTCCSDGIVSFFRQIPSKLAYPQCYQPFWWFCQVFSQIFLSCLIHSTSYSASFVILSR
jgi:hypothetical protein